MIGAGVFGRHHLRILSGFGAVELAGVVDIDADRAAAAASSYGCPAYTSVDQLADRIDAAVVAVPTSRTPTWDASCSKTAWMCWWKSRSPSMSHPRDAWWTRPREHERILQVGHLERFNPAVTALKKIMKIPLFFEIHRLSLLGPRSLDVDVVLDLMIHDLDIVLDLAGAMPEEIRAAGICRFCPTKWISRTCAWRFPADAWLI